MKLKIVRGIQLFWGYFIALGAVMGFGMMIYDPSGVTFQMDPLLPMLREAFPFLSFMFGNFVSSAFALLIVNGITNMISIYLIHSKSKYDALSGLMCGGILMLWLLWSSISGDSAGSLWPMASSRCAKSPMLSYSFIHVFYKVFSINTL